MANIKHMIDTNYTIEALEYLLKPECLSERYYPLIQYKDKLIKQSKRLGCKTKNDISNLSDTQLIDIGLKDQAIIKLLRKFLVMYEPNPQKVKEIEKLNLSNKERFAYQELYYLPGVKQIRASLYYHSGYKSLKDIGNASVKEILEKISLTISKNKLSCIVPLSKEVCTHIAVAKAFTK